MKREGVVYGMPEDEYHGQGEYEEFRLAEFSSSAAKEILKSSAHYEWAYLEGHSKRTKAMDIGTAVHAKVLGVGAETVLWPKEHLTPSGRRSSSKEALAWVAGAEAAGMIVVDEGEQKMIDRMAENVLTHPDVGPALEQAGNPEVSMFGTCPDTGVRMRGRFDFLPEAHPFAIDLKTARDGSLRGFTRAIEDLSYDVQHGHYLDLAPLVGIDWIKEMLFVVVENVAPFNVNVIRLDSNWIEMGHVRALEARRRLVRGIETGEWPGYPAGVKLASPPPWAINRFQDEMNEDMEAMA